MRTREMMISRRTSLAGLSAAGLAAAAGYRLPNVAAEHSEKVRELEAMLDRHLGETGALDPRKNPDYQRGAAAEAAGWRPGGQCCIERKDGALLMHSVGGDPFIVNNAAPEVAGPLVVRFRMRSESEGLGQFFWTTSEAPRFGPHQRLDFAPEHTMAGGTNTASLSSPTRRCAPSASIPRRAPVSLRSSGFVSRMPRRRGVRSRNGVFPK